MDRNMEETVCFCANVTVQDIKDAVDAGADTFEKVQEVTLAGTGCGGCVDEVKALVEEFVAEKNNI